MVWNNSAGGCHNLQLLSLSAKWRSTLHRDHIWLVSRQCTWHFMDLLHGRVHIPGTKTGLRLGYFRNNILSQILLLNSPITVCHPLLYHTFCINAQEQDGKIARVMMRVTAYNLPPNFHFVYIVFIAVYQLSFSTPHILHSWLAVCDHKWDQNLNLRCIV